MKESLKFRKKSLPGVGEFVIPSDISLELPENITLDKEYWHYLTYIPWNDKYLDNVPKDFLDFFKFVLPYLGVRTTDVHVATCLGFLDEMIGKFPGIKVNRRVLAISLILHDIGWSRLSDQEVANSLGVTGLKLSEVAMGPKEKHAVEGENLARELLGEVSNSSDAKLVNSKFEFIPNLLDTEKELIFKSIRYHDRPEEVAGFIVDGGVSDSDSDGVGGAKEMPIEVKLLVDLDHLWSFVYEGFWMDVVRKGVDPGKYLENLSNDLDSYFVTDQGKKLARNLLGERRVEVEKFLSIEW